MSRIFLAIPLALTLFFFQQGLQNFQRESSLKGNRLQKSMKIISDDGGMISTGDSVGRSVAHERPSEAHHHHNKFCGCSKNSETHTETHTENEKSENSHQSHSGHKKSGGSHNSHSGKGSANPLSTGLIFLLQQIGMDQILANILWCQMDMESHRQMWHRVDFYLALIQSIDPYFVEAILLRVYSLEMKKQFARARRVLLDGYRDNPLRSEIPFELGMQYLNALKSHGKGSDPVKAAGFFKATMALDPHPPASERFYAMSLVKCGEKAAAVKFLENLLKESGRGKDEHTKDRLFLDRILSGQIH